MGLLLNRAKANTVTTGTGAVTLGTAVSPYQTWSAAGATSGYWYDYLIEDGTAWEMGMGFYNGTTLTRPGASDPWFTSSTGSLLNLTGSATIACVASKDTLAAGDIFMPPIASSFSLASGDATNLTLTDNARIGLSINGGTPVAGDENRIAYRTLTDKTLDWTMVAKVISHVPIQNYSGMGLTLQDSVSTRATSWTWRGTSSYLQVNNWNSLTSFNAAVSSATNPSTPAPAWLRVRHTSSTYYFDYSVDGVTWINQFSVGDTAFLTNRADRVGFVVDYNRTTGPNVYITCPYFSLTGAAV